MKEKQFIFMNIQNTVPNLYASTLVFAVAVNGKIWNTANSCITSKWSIKPLQHWKVELRFWTNLRFRKTVFYRNKMEFSFQTAAG
jgi:hypothetical protein